MKKIYQLLALLFSTAGLHAQVATLYQFSQDTVPMTIITGGTVLATGTQDDNSYTANPIGFPFTYNGNSYSTFGLSVNGFITFGTTISSNYNAISSTQNSNVIAALSSDLQMGYQFVASTVANSNSITCAAPPLGVYVGATITGPFITTTTVTAITGNTIQLSQNATQSGSGNYTCLGEIRYETVGTTPNRLCVIQWRTASRFVSAGNNFDFQIILHETTNTVECAYNVWVLNSSSTVQTGLRGITNVDYNSRTTANNWQQTNAATSNLATCAFNNSCKPISGLRLIWSTTLSGTSENTALLPVQLFPNPSSGGVTLQLPSVADEIRIELTDMSGRTVHTEQLPAFTTVQQLNLEQLVPGIYFLRITAGERSTTEQLVLAQQE